MGSRILSPEPHSPTRYYKMTASAVTAPAAQSASPVKTKSPAEIQEDANSLLATGKRHLLVGDVPAAVSCLAPASSSLLSSGRLPRSAPSLTSTTENLFWSYPEWSLVSWATHWREFLKIATKKLTLLR